MTMKDAQKLKDIETKLAMVKNTYEEILPIFHALHRRKLSLELDIKILEDQKMDLLTGQLEFDVNNSVPSNPVASF